MVIWLVGLSGAGKSTLGKALYQHSKSKNPATILVDGDKIRALFKHTDSSSDYSLAGRRSSALRLQSLCAWLDSEGLDVICCAISMFQEINDENRQIFSNYREIFVDVPLPRLIEQDSKGLYQAALTGRQSNVVGIDIEYHPPTHPDLVIHNSQREEDISDYVGQMLAVCGEGWQ